MATTKIGNQIYLTDTSGTSGFEETKLLGLIIEPTSANAIVVLGDNNSGTSFPKTVAFETASANDTAIFNLSDIPLVFPSGIKVKSLTNCSVTLIVGR